MQGKENDADTFIEFYRWTGIALKRRGVTWARLDHAGHDPSHQRGSSGKGDDVDVIWKLIKGDGGITLHRDDARMAWVEDKLAYTIKTDPLRYERTGVLWPARTKEIAADLDRLDVPLEAGRGVARKAFKAAGIKATNGDLSAGLRWRRSQAHNLSDLTTDSQKVKSTALTTDSPDSPTNTQVNGPDRSTDSPDRGTGVPRAVSVPLGTDSPDGPPDHALTDLFGDLPVGNRTAMEMVAAAEAREADLPCLHCSGPPHDTTTHTYIADTGEPF
jgi:hypothetical protein